MPSDKALVTLTIDGVEVKAPKGKNLIEVARDAGIEIPHYCYHPCLSVAGNCRMCQVQVEGQRKLTIACNTTAAEGMVVHTQNSSKEVSDAQRATLEFILVNHPLDCTVCDQAGHCKLQDYYYEYNHKPSRFTGQKVQKVKAETLGPEIILDGERCILCTRCVRFCEEVTETSELAVFNRGDHSVIGIYPDKELDNPMSGTVADLCPVGALTHRRWRFNTRIWYTSEVDTICQGCSTGCNVKVAVRDGQVVHVKSRFNPKVNDEWLCDEGRYGFARFEPERRFTAPLIIANEEAKTVDLKEAVSAVATSGKVESPGETAVFLSPFLTLEELWVAERFCKQVLKVDASRVALQIRRRELTSVQAKLISPDYAPNARAAELLGLVKAGENWRDLLEKQYVALLQEVLRGKIKSLFVIGDFAIAPLDITTELQASIEKIPQSVALSASLVERVEESTDLLSSFKVLLPVESVYERSGVFFNQSGRFQRVKRLFTAPGGILPVWTVLNTISKQFGQDLLPETVIDERSLYTLLASEHPALRGVSLGKIGELGLALGEQADDAASGKMDAYQKPSSCIQGD